MSGNGGGGESGWQGNAVGDGSAEWPVELRGVTESLVATLGPNDRWNFAALGLEAGDPVTARTWGQTRTRRNFEREGTGVVQFTRDAVLFVEAALGIIERAEPIVEVADAWVAVEAAEIDRGETRGTPWVDWRLEPGDSAVLNRTVATTNRGYNAVIEATVAASRLGVDAYERSELLDRLEYVQSVVERCGSDRDREAMARLCELVDGID